MASKLSILKITLCIILPLIAIGSLGVSSYLWYKALEPETVLPPVVISTQERKTLSSNVYNVGFDPEDLSLLSLQVRYITNIHVADKQYFYRNFDALLANAKQSSKGLLFVAKVAAESVAGDLKKNAKQLKLASRK